MQIKINDYLYIQLTVYRYCNCVNEIPFLNNECEYRVSKKTDACHIQIIKLAVKFAEFVCSHVYSQHEVVN